MFSILGESVSFYIILAGLFFSILHINDIIFVFLCPVISRAIHVDANGKISFLFMAEKYSIAFIL